jgi:tetratricopeptide (TPR) repeat protein
LVQVDKALAIAPRHGGGLTLKGALLLENGRAEDALASLDQAVALLPNNATAHLNRGNTLARLSRREEAIEAYDRTLAINPKYVAALSNRAGVQFELGRYQLALADAQAALALKPDLANAQRHRANASAALAAASADLVERALLQAAQLAKSGRRQEAIDSLLQLGEPLLASARACAFLAKTLTAGGRAEEALPYFEKSLALDPYQPGVETDMGSALGGLERRAEAIACFDRVLARHPDNLPALNNRASQRLEVQDNLGAIEDADKALAQRPDLASAHRFRARAFVALRRFDEALQAIEGSEKHAPDNSDNPSIRAAALTGLGRFEDAVAALDLAVAREPENANYRRARAYARLRIQDFQGGWADHEYRWKTKAFWSRSRGPVPESIVERLDVAQTAADLTGQRVLLIGEQGVGDQIMFASMIPDLVKVASQVTLVTSQRMQPLMAASFPDIENLESTVGVSVKRFDKIIAIASLGYAFRNARADFPHTPYLHARPSVRAEWSERLGPKTTPLRIGISWRGGSEATYSGARSMSLDLLRPLIERDDVECVNLQYGDVQTEVEAFNATLKRPIRLFPREDIDPFEPLAALVQNLDMVVSVQTSIIHLGGACGAPCLVMIPFIPEWRYGAAGPAMPWYGSVQLFRQSERGDWARVLEDIDTALDKKRAELS